jgi:hypothetical protein
MQRSRKCTFIARRMNCSPKAPALMIFALVLVHPVTAAELQKETVHSWDRYLQWADAKVQRELSDPNIFLIQNTLSSGEKTSVQKAISAGELYAARRTGVVPAGVHFNVPSGEIHHWWGTVLLRNVSLTRLLQFLQDYDHHAGRFSDVERSRLISKDGNRYKIFFRLTRSKAFVTAYYNTEQDCLYAYYGSTKASSRSTATKIAEIENPGTAVERERPPGNDRGFLWRLVSWWRFEQRGKDVVMELESASLSRSIPAVIKFMPGISGYIRSTPRETLESVLLSIRAYMGQPSSDLP